MYWSLTGRPVDFMIWLVQAAAWWAGGWLLAVHLLKLKPRERLFAGLAAGLLLFIVLANLLAQVLPLQAAFWVAAAAILGAGAVAAWRSRPRPWFPREDLAGWPALAAAAGLLVLFLLINRGLAIYDDYHNLPLVSVISAGDVPPRFFLNPGIRLAYHYGLHLFAASLVRTGGLFPWSAFDLTRALTIVLTVMLGWLWCLRLTRSRLAAGLGAALFLFGGGARWLMLFLPGTFLSTVGARLHTLGNTARTGADLYALLSGPFAIEGAGPYPFPFAFMNGIFPPLPLALGGSAAAPYLTLLLLALAFRRRWQPAAGLLYGLLLASLALTAETVFVLAWGGLAGAILLWAALRRRWRPALTWAWVLLPSALLAAFGGGLISETLRAFTAGQDAATTGFTGFSLHAPITLVSAHLGELALTDPAQALLALLEVGPALLLLPLVLVWAWRELRRGRPLVPALALAALFGLVLPMVLEYEQYERDITRLSSAGLFLLLVMGFPLAWKTGQKSRRELKFLLGLGYGVAVFGGLLVLAVQLTAVPRPQLTYFVQQPDARLSRDYWNRFGPGEQVFDDLPFRSVTLFGRPVQSSVNTYTLLPEWEALAANPDPAALAQAGYSYLYLDDAWWLRLTPAQQQALQQPCLKRMAEAEGEAEGFRILLDLRGCQP